MNRYRFNLFIAIIIIIPLGLVSKFYNGPLYQWLNNYSGGIFYEIFWILLVILINPKIPPLIAAIWVFMITALLEFMQLWHPPFLEAIRATLIGRLLIGTTFDWWDFPHYILGCTITWLGLKTLKNQLDK
jgi:Protein of unknown function (DUF2809)